jgi:hypothetical protein
MYRSQNGWLVLETAPPRQVIIPRVLSLSLRPGDVTTVLGFVARRFHELIEPLDMSVSEEPGYDDWGWAYRPIRGKTTGFSNHASATAIDLNATQHPRGVKGTFTDEEKRTIREQIIARTEDPETGLPVVRWGEDYSGTIDGMHFEINANEAAVSRAANAIRASEEVVPEGDEDMFLAGVAGADQRVFLIGAEGKRLVPSRPVFDELVNAGVKYVGEMSSTALNMFPTIEAKEKAESDFRTTVSGNLVTILENTTKEQS